MLDLACVMQQGFDALLPEISCGSLGFCYIVLCLSAFVVDLLCLRVSYLKLLQCTWIYLYVCREFKL